MGSWNQTCGITQLPICQGQEVALFLLIENSLVSSWESGGHCYGNAYWTPRSIQLYGTYEDYGQFEIKDDWNRQFAIDFFQVDGFEMALGENESHDVEVTKEKLKEWEFIGEAIHESRLFVNCDGGNRQIGHVAVHRKIFDDLVNHKYDRWGEPLNLKTMKQSANEYINQIKEYLSKDHMLVGTNINLSSVEAKGLDKFFLFNPDRTLFGNVFESSGSNTYKSIHGAHSIYRKLLADNLDSPLLGEIITEMSKYALFDHIFYSMRKTWMPQAGAGSQSEDLEIYEVIMKASKKVIKERNSWFDDY